MNSINREQREDNREDLLDQKAVEKIKALVKNASTCLFCTAITTGKAVWRRAPWRFRRSMTAARSGF